MSRPRALAALRRYGIGLLSIAALVLAPGFWEGPPSFLPSAVQAAPPEGKGGGDKGGGGDDGGTTPTYTQLALGMRAAFHINELGDVVGNHPGPDGGCGALIVPVDIDDDGVPDIWYYDTDGDGENDLITLLPTLPGYGHDAGFHYQALSSNILGQIVGTARNDTTVVVVVWQLQPDGSIAVTGFASQEFGFQPDINAWGEVVLWANGGDGNQRLFVIDPLDVDSDGLPDTWFVDDGFGGNALMVDLGVGYWGWPTPRINDDGWIIANADKLPFYSASPQPVVIIPRDSDGDGAPDTWYVDGDGDGFNDLESPLPLFPNSTGRAWGLNSNGQVVGSNPSGGTPVVWTVAADGDAKRSKLPVSKELWQAEAAAINNAGQIVGNGNSNQVPLLWRDGELFNLNDLVTNGPAALIDAYAINRYGEILARRTVELEGGGTTTEPVLLLPNAR